MYLVRLQKIALDIDQTFKDPVLLQLNKGSIQMHNKMLLEELRRFKSSLPPDLQQNGTYPFLLQRSCPQDLEANEIVY